MITREEKLELLARIERIQTNMEKPTSEQRRAKEDVIELVIVVKRLLEEHEEYGSALRT